MAKSTTAWAPGSNGNGGNLGGVPADSILKAGTFASVNVPTEIVGSEVDRWFLALDQGSSPLPCTSIWRISTSTPTSAW